MLEYEALNKKAENWLQNEVAQVKGDYEKTLDIYCNLDKIRPLFLRKLCTRLGYLLRHVLNLKRVSEIDCPLSRILLYVISKYGIPNMLVKLLRCPSIRLELLAPHRHKDTIQVLRFLSSKYMIFFPIKRCKTKRIMT